MHWPVLVYRIVSGMNVVEHLHCLFNPRSAAVIGASNVPGKWGCDILNLLLTNGDRKVYPIETGTAPRCSG